MQPHFEELDHRPTHLGELSLRRRTVLSLGIEVVEVKLGNEYLMSSLFTESEKALGTAGVEECLEGRSPYGTAADGTAPDALEPEGAAPPSAASVDVVVGGLGLGYTARAVLDNPAVRSLLVVELFDAVVEWHTAGILPLGTEVSGDPRTRFVVGDFFARAALPEGFDPEHPGRQFHAVLLDIDHSPEMLLDPANERFYTEEGLRDLCHHLLPGGVFALWSNDLPAPAFVARLRQVFARAEARPVTFRNPLQDRDYTQTIYLARRYGTSA
ncbi:MAG: spermidine synthase [bacterium]